MRGPGESWDRCSLWQGLPGKYDFAPKPKIIPHYVLESIDSRLDFNYLHDDCMSRAEWVDLETVRAPNSWKNAAWRDNMSSVFSILFVTRKRRPLFDCQVPSVFEPRKMLPLSAVILVLHTMVTSTISERKLHKSHHLNIRMQTLECKATVYNEERLHNRKRIWTSVSYAHIVAQQTCF